MKDQKSSELRPPIHEATLLIMAGKLDPKTDDRRLRDGDDKTRR